MIDSADTTVTRSGSTYRLTVPAPEAVSALGTAALRMLARKQLDVKQLKGDVPFEVVVRIESIRMDATGLMGQILDMVGTKAPQGA